MSRLIIGKLPTLHDDVNVDFQYLEEIPIDDDDIDATALIRNLLEKLQAKDQQAVHINIPEDIVQNTQEDIHFLLTTEQQDNIDVSDNEILAQATQVFLEAFDPAVDTANLVAGTTEEEDTTSHDSLQSSFLTVHQSDQIDPFDPVVSVAEGDKESIMIRGGTDTINSLKTRISTTGTLLKEESHTTTDPSQDPPLTALIEDAFTAVTTLLARVASTQAQEDITDLSNAHTVVGSTLQPPGSSTTNTTTLSKTEDAANGHTLTENGSPADRSSPASKFDEGYDMDGSDDSLTNGDDGLSESGDFAASFAFEVDAYPSSGEETVAVVQEDAGDPYWKALVDANQDLVFDAGPFGVGSLGSLASTGFFSAWVKRSVSSVALSKTEDAANNHPLTENGTPPNDTSADAKYGVGYDLSASGDYLSQADAALEINGDLSLSVSFEVNNLPSGSAVLFYHGVSGDETESGNVLYMIRVQSDGTIRYLHESGGGNNTLIDSTNTIGTGAHTLTLQRDTANKRLVVKVDGTTFIDTTYSNNPSGGGSGDLYIGARSDGADQIDGDIHEMRVWSQLVGTTDDTDTDDLDRIADPSNRGASGFEQRTEGNEVACWFMGDNEDTSTVQAKVYDSSGNVVFNNTKDRNQPSLDGTANIDLGATQLDGGLYEVRYWLSGNVPSVSTLDSVADPTVTGSAGHEQRLEGNEEACWFFGDDLITGTTSTGAENASPASDLFQASAAARESSPVTTPTEPGSMYDLNLAREAPSTPFDGENRLDAILTQDMVSKTDTQTPTADVYAALQDLTAGANATGVPNGGLDQVAFDGTRGQGSVMVGEPPQSSLPNRTLGSLLYWFMIPESLSNDTVNVKWEVPPPNFIDNWHFTNGITNNGWSIVDGTASISFNHDTDEGYRSLGCLALDSGTTATDRDQLHQRVTNLATGTGRKITVKLQHFSTDTSITAHDVRLRVYEDSSGSKGTELANVQLSGSDGSWTMYTLEGDSSGTLDFSISDTVSAIWVEIDVNDQDSTSTVNRRIDDVRCEVTGLGETTVTEQTAATYPTDGQKPFYLNEEDMEAFTNGDDISVWGWNVDGNSDFSTTISTDVAADGSQSIEIRAESDLTSSDNEFAHRSLPSGISDGVFMVRMYSGGGDRTNIGFYPTSDASGTDETELYLDPQDNAVAVNFASGDIVTLGSFTVDTWYTFLAHVQGNTMSVYAWEGTGKSGTFLGSATGDVTASTPINSVNILFFAFNETSVSSYWDIIEYPQPLAVDVSSHNLGAEEVSRLLAWVEHVDNGDSVNDTLVESIGLRY